MTSRRLPLAGLLGALCAVLLGCGGGAGPDARDGDRDDGDPRGAFAATERAARGQTVSLWAFGGDEDVNRFLDDTVAPAVARRGVRLRRVPVGDTADALQRVIAERRAGRTDDGAVDLVWLNGENFATGRRAGLWRRDWAGRLPSARFLDPADPTVRTDFGVPVDGQESPWQRAAFVFAHDARRTPRPPRSLDELLAYARANPGRVTYPQPPDFTGSAFVRLVVAARGEERGFAYLRELAPLLYRGGASYPRTEAEQVRLLADGEVDVAMSYDPAFVASNVRQGTLPDTARPFVLRDGTLQNVSFVTIPANAENAEGAEVVAEALLSPELQAVKARPDVLGNPTVLDPARLGRRAADLRAAGDGPYLLGDLGRPLPELPADRVEPLERRWQRDILRAGRG